MPAIATPKRALRLASVSTGALDGLGRTAEAQAAVNLANALRALDLVPRSETDLLPHPIDIVRAEIRNAMMYLNQPQE